MYRTFFEKLLFYVLGLRCFSEAQKLLLIGVKPRITDFT
jgi:hypothetical protein